MLFVLSPIRPPINETVRILEKPRKRSFLDILFNVLEEFPDEMTDKDIREEVDTFLFEGHDTSSASMIMTIILLGMHQDVQVWKSNKHVKKHRFAKHG